MAASVMTPGRARFDASFSASTMRSADLPPSIADTLPNIDFGFDKLRRDMASFRAQFDNFIERGRLRIIEERNLFQGQMADIQKSQLATKREIEAVKADFGLHRDMLGKEEQEIDEIKEAITGLEIQRDEQQAKRDEHRVQVAQLQDAVNLRRQQLQKQQRHLDDQAASNGPELRFWEQSLGLQMQSLGVEDRLRFVFSVASGGTNGSLKECSFDLDMSDARYHVIATEPAVDHDAVTAVLDRLNETRDLAPFLKRMRAVLQQAI